jgi:RNA polymerase subunit RPABC4/transcription elongation factor Spt4
MERRLPVFGFILFPIINLILLLLLLATQVLIAVWVYRDAKERKVMPGWLAVLLVVIVPHIAGLIAYLIIRAVIRRSACLCSACGASVDRGARFCPNCAAPVGESDSTGYVKCAGCGEVFRQDARYCSHCGSANENNPPAQRKSSAAGRALVILLIVAAIVIALLVGAAVVLFSVAEARRQYPGYADRFAVCPPGKLALFLSGAPAPGVPQKCAGAPDSFMCICATREF